MITDVLAYLRCPLCRAAPLAADAARPPRALRCPHGHGFDVARQGYVNLGTGRSPHAGDTAEMIAARTGFLAAGHYDFVRDALVRLAADTVPTGSFAIDAGAGTGWHLAGLLAARPDTVGLALDVSKPALRRAARAHPRAAAASADTWAGLPVRDAAADLLLNVFAPRNGAEFRRILRDTGALLVVTPDAEHLAEVVAPLGLLRVDPAKPERVADSLARWFEPTATGRHHRTLRLPHPQLTTLVGMGPSARHLEPARLAAAVAQLPAQVTVTAAVRLTAYRPSRP